MSDIRLIRTIHQYNSKPVAKEDMEKLIAVSKDYGAVKQYVYDHYNGIKSLAKLYPGYTVQNEMTACGLRKRLGLPSIYFYLAIYDALGDIKSEWSRLMGIIREHIKKNENFSPEEKHYLRYCLKMDSQLEAVLNRMPVELPEIFRDWEIPLEVNRLHNYLRRQVRRYKKMPVAKNMDYFQVSERGYRYGDGGIYISTKEYRKRVFIPLTDHCKYDRQLNIKLMPENEAVVIDIPVEMKRKEHHDYHNEIGLAYGYHVMFTTSDGNRYGEELGSFLMKKADWRRKIQSQKLKIQIQARDSESDKARNINENNLGNEKYLRLKRKYDGQICSYINGELNRLIETEKPSAIYLPKLPQNISSTRNTEMNSRLNTWQRGYIRSRLEFKCRQHSIEVIEVWGKDISNVCFGCGVLGRKEEDLFVCPTCGLRTEVKKNSALNALNRGRD